MSMEGWVVGGGGRREEAVCYVQIEVIACWVILHDFSSSVGFIQKKSFRLECQVKQFGSNSKSRFCLA